VNGEDRVRAGMDSGAGDLELAAIVRVHAYAIDVFLGGIVRYQCDAWLNHDPHLAS